MNWRELLQSEIKVNYNVADQLFDWISDKDLAWKPAGGSNWMTVGQLLMHVAVGTGPAFKAVITGDWGLPEGKDPSEMSEEEMLPPAEKMPAVETVDQAKQLLQKDMQETLDYLSRATDERLENEPAPVPWDPTGIPLGYRLLQFVIHLNQHKGQLFYYLKLQEKPVSTQHLWGM
jgi:uncharacterized damage-inducible protein DinB